MRAVTDKQAAQAEREAYIKKHRAIEVDGHAYWIDPAAKVVWGLSAHKAPGHETYQGAGPWTVALWEELEAHRSALAEAEKALREWGQHGHGGLQLAWSDRDRLTALADRLASVRVADVREVEKERDEARAEASKLRAVLAAIAEAAQAAQ